MPVSKEHVKKTLEKVLEKFTYELWDESKYDIPLADLGVDSIDKVEIIINLEHDLGILIPDEHVDDLDTGNKLLEYLNKYLVA